MKKLPKAVVKKLNEIKNNANKEYDRLSKMLNDYDWFNNPNAWLERHFGEMKDKVLDDRGMQGLVDDLLNGKVTCLDEINLADMIIKNNTYYDWMSLEGAEWNTHWVVLLAKYQARFENE